VISAAAWSAVKAAPPQVLALSGLSGALALALVYLLIWKEPLPSLHAFLKVARGLKEKTFFGKFGVLILTKTKKGQNGV